MSARTHRADCPGGDRCTLNVGLSHAPMRALMATRGWGSGTTLVGDEGYGDDRITLRYVGPQALIAHWHRHDRESLTTLGCRCWSEAP